MPDTENSSKLSPCCFCVTETLCIADHECAIKRIAKFYAKPSTKESDHA